MNYYFADHLGSASVVTDASGSIQEESDYYPFGGERSITDLGLGNHYKFTGKERDAETGLDDFGAGYYSSAMGRFVTPDWSSSPSGVPYADLHNPQYKYIHDVLDAAAKNYLLSSIGVAATVTFGHGARHLAGSGLDQAEVEAAIKQDIEGGVKGAARPRTGFRGQVNVGGKTIEYRAYTLPNGTIRVGTYYIP